MRADNLSMGLDATNARAKSSGLFSALMNSNDFASLRRAKTRHAVAASTHRRRLRGLLARRHARLHAVQQTHDVRRQLDPLAAHPVLHPAGVSGEVLDSVRALKNDLPQSIFNANRQLPVVPRDLGLVKFLLVDLDAVLAKSGPTTEVGRQRRDVVAQLLLVRVVKKALLQRLVHANLWIQQQARRRGVLHQGEALPLKRESETGQATIAHLTRVVDCALEVADLDGHGNAARAGHRRAPVGAVRSQEVRRAVQLRVHLLQISWRQLGPVVPLGALLGVVSA
mmetsp:Transcript_16943/g.48145  ORF Transcript_16943/g.48145 Transcript_16943/m.48145 type:complete len:282 (+) Transcript_16943:1149-1994(+)